MKKLPCTTFGENFTKKEAFIVIPVLVLFVLLAVFGTYDSFAANALFMLLILIAVSGTVWQSKRLKEFKCPHCGLAIPEPTKKYRSEGEPINYYCPNCDIEWVTGLSETGAS